MNTPARDLTIACIALVLGWSGPSALAATASFTTDIGTKSVKCDVTVPDDVNPVRGMVIVYAWGGSVEAARALGVGIISVEANSAADWREGNAKQAQAMLDAAAEAVKRPEIRNAPLMMVGSSWGGFMSVELMKLVPERTIAYACLWSAHPAPEAGSPELSVPGIWATGSLDYPGLVQSNYFGLWRVRDAQAALAIDWGLGHCGATPNHTPPGSHETEIAWFWFSEAMRLRYPGGLPARGSGEPVTLRNIKTADGWLGDVVQWDTIPRARDRKPGVGYDKSKALTPLANVSPFTPIAAAKDYKQDAANASWMPSQDAAFVYRALNSVDSIEAVAGRKLPPYQTELCFSSPKPLGLFTVGDKVPVAIDARAFHAAKMELYDGSALIATATDPTSSAAPATPPAAASAPAGANVWRFTFVPKTTGIHALVAIAYDSDGEPTSAFRCVAVKKDEKAQAGAEEVSQSP